MLLVDAHRSVAMAGRQEFVGWKASTIANSCLLRSREEEKPQSVRKTVRSPKGVSSATWVYSPGDMSTCDHCPSISRHSLPVGLASCRHAGNRCGRTLS